MVTLHPLDIVLIILYFVIILFVGFRAARRASHREEDFLLAGRTVTLPIFIMTLVSTWYGGILGIGEFTYLHGISNWLILGAPYYFFAALFAVLLAKRIRSTNLSTIPDKLHASYDKKTAILGAVLMFLLTSPAAYVLMLSMVLQLLFGWSLLSGMMVTAFVVFSYLYVGGLRSDIATDVVEFVLMFAGFFLIVPFAVSRYGGWDYLATHLPPMHLVWHGGHSVQYLVAWFFIALWTLVDPGFHQRCYAARDGATARKGILFSIIFWFVFDCLTLTTGLYARAALPDLHQPAMSYPLFAESVLPPIAKGVFYIGMLATFMSTLNTLAFVSAQTLGRDLLLRIKFIPKQAGFAGLREAELSGRAVRYTQIGLVVTFLISVVLALALPSVIQIWYTLGTITIPGLLIPLMTSYFSPLNVSVKYAFPAMLFGWLTSLGWFVAGRVGDSVGYPFGVEPMFPGLVISLIVWGIGKIDSRDPKRIPTVKIAGQR